MPTKALQFDRRTVLKSGLITALAPLVGSAQAEHAVQKMHTRTIPSSGQQIGVIAYGGSPAFRGAGANYSALTQELIEILLSSGGNYIDANGNIPQKLAEFIIPKKLALLDLAVGAPTVDFERGAACIKQIQTLVNRDPIQFIQTRVSNLRPDREDFAVMNTWKEEGLVKHIGFSGMNYFDYAEQLITELKPDYLQMNYSLFEPDAENRALLSAQEHGVAVVVNRPFMNGKYFSKVKCKPLPEWVAEFGCQSWAQFSLKYIAAHPGVTTVLTETAKPKHARDNVAAGFGRLPDEKQRKRMLQYVQSM
ncbi:MAG: aryl-alcohol dehydrogenase-like predicted oxidoreductase [Cryomorphaceae bacterium]|jgi:aryl-alcohol dehydrogenase-like predicted oxidoreductase